eukprot:6163107-Pleurochrysis_carterae.AAC.1
MALAMLVGVLEVCARTRARTCARRHTRRAPCRARTGRRRRCGSRRRLACCRQPPRCPEQPDNKKVQGGSSRRLREAPTHARL